MRWTNGGPIPSVPWPATRGCVPEKASSTIPNFVTGLYDGEVKYLDDGIGHLIRSLEEMGQLDNTMIVFMADHGESMTEHRMFYDHYGLYDCTIRVPFIVKWPAGNLKAGLRLAPVRQSYDVAPSILEACGIDFRTNWTARASSSNGQGKKNLRVMTAL